MTVSQSGASVFHGLKVFDAFGRGGSVADLTLKSTPATFPLRRSPAQGILLLNVCSSIV